MFPQFSSPAIRTHIENMLGLYVDMTQRLLEAAQNLSALNMQLGRDLLNEAGANMQRLMASKDPGQLGSAIAAHMMPGSQALGTYQRRATEILSRCQAGVTQVAADHMPAVRRSAAELAEGLVQEAASHTARAAEQLAKFQPGSQLHH